MPAAVRKSDVMVKARVLFFRWSDGSMADVRSTERVAYVHLNCGHISRRRTRRRLLIGELVRCPVCEGVEPVQQTLPEFKLESPR